MDIRLVEICPLVWWVQICDFLFQPLCLFETQSRWMDDLCMCGFHLEAGVMVWGFFAVSPAKHPYNITLPPPCFTVGITHAEIISSPILHLTKTRWLEPKIANLDSSDQRTDFHRSNVHCSSFLAQVKQVSSYWCPLVVAAIRPWRPDLHSLLWSVVAYMCLSLEVLSIYWGCNLRCS